MLDASDPNFENQLAHAIWSTGGSSDYRNDRERPYNGQLWTDEGERGKTIVEGLTMRDVRDCLRMAFLLASGEPDLHNSVEAGTWRAQDVYRVPNDVDFEAVGQNLTCCIERMMGIFPNVPQLVEATPAQAATDG